MPPKANDLLIYQATPADALAYTAKAADALANSAIVKSVTLSKNPLTYWRLDDSGNVAKDSSGNGFDATIQGYADLVKAKGANLVGYWRLEETSGTVAADSSGNGRNGTSTGVALGQAGPLLDPDFAYSFPDAAGVTTVNTPFAFTGSFTIEMLLQTSRPSEGYRGICGEYNGTNTGYDLGIQTGALRMTVRGAANIDTGASAAVVNDGLWHHVAVVVSNSQILIYVDGILKQTTAGTWTPVTNTAAFAFGRRASGDGLGQCFIGALDEVALYNVALTATEVSQHYNAALVTRMVARGVSSLMSGDPNDAGMMFDGVSGFASYAGPNISQGDFSLAAWIVGTSATWGGTTHAQVVGGAAGAIGLEVSSNGGWFVTEIAKHQGPSATLGNIPINTLTHLVVTFVFATKTVTFAKNGALDVPKSFAGYDPTVAAAQSRIGRTNAYASAFPGVIKDVSIYNRALSPADISDLYHAGANALGALATSADKEL